MRRAESPRCILWVRGGEPLEPTAEAHPSPPRYTAQPNLPSSEPGTGWSWWASSGLGLGGQRPGISLLCSLPKQEVAVFRKCQLIPSCCCQKGKGKKKKNSLVSRKLTTTSENRVNMMDAFIPLNIQQRPEARVCHTRFGAAGSGPGGPGPSLGPGVVPPGPTPGFLEGSVFSPSSFPGIMALDINDSR